MNFGERFKELRLENGLTQFQLAEMLDISKSNISKYEAGSIEPNLEIMTKIAIRFGVTTDYLLGLTNNRSGESDLAWRYPHTQNRLGSILFKYREHEHLSTDSFAQKLGISEALETKLEQGVYVPSIPLIKKIAIITGYDIDYLTGAIDSTLVLSGQDCNFGGKISPITYLESNHCFKTRFEELRLRYEISADKIEEWLGLSHQEYIDIQFNRMPTLSELLRLAYAFNVSIDYLVGKTDAPISGLSEDEVELLLNYRDCLSVYKKNIRERAEKLALESINPVAAGENLKEAK